MENVIILGSGVAGLSAAIYNARAELRPLIITGTADGGQIATTTEVENFPGFPEGIMGPELVRRMKEQAERFGARTIYEEAQAFSVNTDGTFTITTDSNSYQTKALIIATGASAKWLDIAEEERFKSNGVHTCATCDGAFYKGKDIIVVGGGDAACEEADFLSKFASNVTLLVRGEQMRASVPMQERVAKNKKIHITYNAAISAYKGDEKGLSGVTLKNNLTGKETEQKIDGVFLAIGHTPNTSIFTGKLNMDKTGYLIVNQKTETSVPGVFAGGDVADNYFRQAITAAGTGAAAAIRAEKYLAEKEHS